MTVRVAERRRSIRIPAAYPTLLYDQRGRILARGRTANVSEHGLFVIVGIAIPPEEGKTILAEITLPADPAGTDTRKVIYCCRIVRKQELGQLVGLGVEFYKKPA